MMTPKLQDSSCKHFIEIETYKTTINNDKQEKTNLMQQLKQLQTMIDSLQIEKDELLDQKEYLISLLEQNCQNSQPPRHNFGNNRGRRKNHRPNDHYYN